MVSIFALRRSRLRSLLLGIAVVAGCSSAPKKPPAAEDNPTSPRACITLAKMKCSQLFTTLRAEIPVGTPRADAEAVLTKYNLPFRYAPKAAPSANTEPRPSRMAGRLVMGLDDGQWPKQGARGYLVDVYIDKENLVAGFHVNTLTAP